MKYILKYFLFAFAVIAYFSACNKVPDLPFYPNGNAPVLSSSATELDPAPADSLNTVVTFSWTSPKYATDTSTVKFIVEIDSAGRNFSNAVSRTITGSLNTNFTGKDLNTIL